MKKVLFAILLISSPVFGAMSGRLDSLKIAVNVQSGLASTGNDRYSSAVLTHIINRATQRVSTDFPAVEKKDTIVTVIEQKNYAANSDFVAIQSCFKWVTDSVAVPLEYKPVDEWFKNLGALKGADNLTDNGGEILENPRYVMEHKKYLTFYPQPFGGDTIEVNYYAFDGYLTNATDSTAINPEYREAVVFYACYLMALATKQWPESVEFARQYNAMNPKQRIEIEASK